MRLLIRLAAASAVVVTSLTTAVLGPPHATASEDPVVVSGRVTHEGLPAPAAQIELRAWPPVEELAALPVGATVHRPIVGRVVADAQGRYALRLERAEVEPYLNESGTLDLEMVTSYAGRAVTWPFSADDERRLDVELGAKGGVRDLRAMGRRTTPAVVVPKDGVDLCGHVELGPWFYDNREKFMVVHNWPGAKATVEQAIMGASSHELGVAVKYPGKVWQPQGTLSLTQGESAGSGARVSGIVNKAIYNSVNYREIVYRTWSSHEVCHRDRRPMSFYDLLNEPHTDITHISYRKGCTIRRSGEIWKDSQTNQTFRGGVDLGVINLSAQSGYSEGTRVGFTITRRTRICTNSDEGWLEATRFDLRSPRTSPPGVV